MRLFVSLVTYNAADLTIDCLDSIASELERVPECRVIVIDNCSSDGSAERIGAALEQRGYGWAEFVVAPSNRGYAAGNNIAIRMALESADPPDYILLLNPDTVVRPNAFRILIDFMDAHPDAGIAGSRSEDPDGTPQCCCFRFPSAASEFLGNIRIGLLGRIFHRARAQVPISDAAHEIDWVSGASMIIRRSVFDDAGLMDEGYFLYFEETDFTLRARRAGWKCWHVPESRVVHFVGHTGGISKRDGPRRRHPTYWFDSRRRYFLKNRGVLYTALVDFATISGIFLWNLRAMLLFRANTNPPMTLRDYCRHSVFISGTKLPSQDDGKPIAEPVPVTGER